MTSRLLSALLVVGACLAGCSSFDPGLIENPPKTHKDSGVDGVGKAGSGANGDSGAMPDATVDPTPGSGGAGGGGGGGSGSACQPNQDSADEGCPLICPETCNGTDDDCDRIIDEGAVEALCVLEHATAACTKAGKCAIIDCTDSFRDCDADPDNGCEAPLDDTNNCGVCGTRCDFLNAAAACVDGVCVATGCNALFADCDSDPDSCETASNTLTNCARCGLGCSDVSNATPSCELGFCGVGQCSANYADCNATPGDGCEKPLDTLSDCGDCNQSCDLPGSVDTCGAGVCVVSSCEANFKDCDGDLTNGCESLDSADHCGTCGAACDASLTNVATAQCSGMTCGILTCDATFGNCDSNPGNGCETDVTTLSRCGDCNTPCAINHAVASCDTGTCTFVKCDPGWDNCNGDLSPLDGCETSLNSDTACGSCTNNCIGTPLPVCSGGSCSALVCPQPNTADCNGEGLVCEVNLLTDASNCGACDFACAFTTATPHAAPALTCQNGGCKPSCDALQGNCNNDYRDGCEQALRTLTACGGCGVGCSIANATPTCASGSCQVQTCNPDWTDCNGGPLTCETQLGTVANCTGCGAACNLPNAIQSCIGSPGSHSCAVASCSQAYYADCNTTASDGCEIDKRSSTTNCNACGNNCGAHANVSSATCSSSACNYTCASGFGNCTSAAGCETPLNTNTNCAGCGTACARTNGVASCSTGTCTLTGCNTNFGNCDANAANGCEPLTSVTNCNACGTPCTIANGTGNCATRTCQIASCNVDWADCDGNPSNGCERNTKPPASGGQGPCVPDTGCTRQTFGGRDYFFCTTARTWADAQSRCRLQLLGDLVHIDNAPENAFMQSNIAADAWSGANDAAAEGVWRWTDDSAQFWMGNAAGSVVTYANWNAGEPNDGGGNQDCGKMYTSGLWDDETCTILQNFVCEVQADLCPNNPKTSPGQCGCAVADTDTDGDNTADCNDGCDNDALKTSGGSCGCGNAETDGDGDGTPNCIDGCPSDPLKIAPLACGCGVADTNFDGDSRADCVDVCPYDAAHIVGTCAYGYTPSNVTPGTLNFTAAPDLSASCGGTIALDTGSTNAVIICGTSITPVVQLQSGGPELWILPLKSLVLASGTTLKFTGARPAVLAVVGNATISGTLDVGATGATPGAGGNVSCAAGMGLGADGMHDNDANDGDGGGGGGGFGSAGLAGGAGNDGGGGGAAGGLTGGATLVPLRGGCRGGSGGVGGNVNGAGAGGGAVQLAVGGLLTLGSTAVITAAGGGGLVGGADEESGGGGGSGGAVFMEASVLNINASAWLAANGGAGAGGNATNAGRGNPGTDGFKTSTSLAPGGGGGDGGTAGGLLGSCNHSDGGKGGDGAALAGSPTSGANASAPSSGLLCNANAGGGGGGGGGGAGRIRVHGIAPACSVPSARVSPAASVACP